MLLKVLITGGNWEVRTGTGEVIRGTAANAHQAQIAANKAVEDAARRAQQAQRGQHGD